MDFYILIIEAFASHHLVDGAVFRIRQGNVTVDYE